MSPQPTVQLTTREQNLLGIIQSVYPPARPRTAAEWLQFRGLGRTMLGKLHALGLVLPPKAPSALSRRAHGVLVNGGLCETGRLPSKTTVRKAMPRLLYVRSCGRKTFEELYNWAYGLAKPTTESHE